MNKASTLQLTEEAATLDTYTILVHIQIPRYTDVSLTSIERICCHNYPRYPLDHHLVLDFL